MKPKIFIGSSVEGLSVAYAIQQNLLHDAEATVWSQGVFDLSDTTIESLNKVLDSVDFSIFVFSPDDETTMRGVTSSAIRDNVLFEFGLFIGKLGRNRVFFIVPSGSDVHIPTDLLGVTSGNYDPNRTDKNLEAATGVVCNQIRKQFATLGCIRVSTESEESDKSNDESKDSDNSWCYDFFKKDFESAKTKLENIMSTESGDDLLRHKAWLAYIYFKENEKDGLQELYNLADTYKDDLAIQEQIPRMLLWEGYNEKAIELVNNALDKQPLNNDLIVLLADCHKGNDDIDKAREILNSVSSSGNPEIAIELSDSYQETDDFDKAIAVIHSAYINFPNNESIIYKYSRLLEEKNRNKEALYLLNALTISYPKNDVYWGYLGNRCLQLDMYDKAMVAYKKAEELSESKSSWILHNIGNIMHNKGFHTEGISWLNKGLDLERSSQYAHSRLAEAIKSQEEENKTYQNICKEGRKLIRDFISE